MRNLHISTDEVKIKIPGLTCVINCYKWLLYNKIISPEYILKENNPDAHIFIDHFCYNTSILTTKKFKNPKIVACTDGVGTKIEVANILNKYDTVGIDLVAMSVNDLIVQGAKPLFFLDYISINKIDLKKNEINNSWNSQRV